MGARLEHDRPIASVMHDVVGNLARIVRAEVQLAKIQVVGEMTVAAGTIGSATKLVVAGVVIGQAAVGFLLLVCVRGLEKLVAPWLAALVVGLGAAGVAAGLLAAGLKQFKRVDLLPASRNGTSTQEGERR